MKIYKHISSAIIRLIICLTMTFVLESTMAQTKRALIVGISEYQRTNENSWENIHGANDADLITPILKKQGFSTVKICNKDATAKRIRKELENLAASCKRGDIVYIHFSCHGQPVEDLDGDEDDGWDEALVPVDAQKVYQKEKYTGENHILDDELNKYICSARTQVGSKGFVYVVIDACHAGSSYRGDEESDSVFVRGTNRGFTSTGKVFAPKIDKRGKLKVEKNSKMSDVCILEACRAYQTNSEIRENGVYYGSLSYYVYKVLKKSLLGKNISWTNEVAKLMNVDVRLIRQNLVIETSL